MMLSDAKNAYAGFRAAVLCAMDDGASDGLDMGYVVQEIKDYVRETACGDLDTCIDDIYIEWQEDRVGK